jgi:hypothetical protein
MALLPSGEVFVSQLYLALAGCNSLARGRDHRFRFFFGAFNDGNDLWARNIFRVMELWKIVSLPLGHPPFANIFEALSPRTKSISL